MRSARLLAALFLLSVRTPALADAGLGGPTAPSSPLPRTSANVDGGIGGSVPRHPSAHAPARPRSNGGAATIVAQNSWRDPRIVLPSRVSEPGAGFDPSAYQGYYGRYGYSGSSKYGSVGVSSQEDRVPIPDSFKSWRVWSPSP